MDTLQRQITAEQYRAVYKQLPAVVSAAAGAGVLVYILKGIHPFETLLAWLGTVLMSCIIAGLLYLYYVRRGQDDLSHSRWKILFTILVLFIGIVWGAIGVLFYPAPVEYKLLIVVWVWALGAGMATLLVAYRPAFYAMIIPLFLPLTVNLSIDGDGFYRGLAVATFLWMTSLMYFYHVNHKTFMEAISLRFINAELAEDLAGKNREAENANLAKSRFLAAASHDLRQPLHAQGLFLSELDQHVDSPTGRRILGGLESSVYAMRKLLNAILDISRLDAGTITPSKKNFPVSIVLKLLKTEFEALAAEKDIGFRIRECNLSVNSDPILLERILRNLIANAIRYTDKGGVLVGCRRHADSVSIQVFDTGTGIPADKQEEIFIPFMQLGNPERDREKGIGLGLSIVQRTASLLGHVLELTSTQDVGTTVSIDVPLSDQALLEVHDQLPETNMDNIRGKRVLVIDDDADVRTAMLSLLKSWGCIPIVFPGIRSALEYAESSSETIDAILSDLNMPGSTDGLQAIADLRILYQSAIPAALITGDTSVNQLREAKDSGYRIAHKPVLASELRALINKLVELSE